jgi:hypothetical protein
MEEHKLLDILIHFRTLIVTTDKIKKLDPTVTFTDDLLLKRQQFFDKLLFLLNDINDDDVVEPRQDELSNKLNSMANLLGGEKIVESGDINTAVFDNFGSGLARLLGGGGGLAPKRQATVEQQIQIQLPINQNLNNENLSFNIKKKSVN